ncbi:hypothetical protein CGRA01v4_13479 [Colletotrichum graminicola]|nr:hypothetical protein CGRA01v4_13479 [Colletotrichum graminicola]
MPQLSGQRLGTRLNRHRQFSSPAQKAVKIFFITIFLMSFVSSPFSHPDKDPPSYAS